jgi:hypothetical protein
MRVLRVTQSPMNAERWVLDLECGHEEWVTSKRRPVRRTHLCTKCETRVAVKEPDSMRSSRSTFDSWSLIW